MPSGPKFSDLFRREQSEDRKAVLFFVLFHRAVSHGPVHHVKHPELHSGIQITGILLDCIIGEIERFGRGQKVVGPLKPET